MNTDRILHLVKAKESTPKEYILYFMQQSQRYSYNHALAFAITLSNQHHLPLVVFFGLTASYPEANIRHYTFMLEGLKELSFELFNKGISFVIELASPDHGIQKYLEKAKALVFDIGYTHIQRMWRKNIYYEIMDHHPSIDLYSVESDVIVPVKIVSDKCEYGAYTIRPKIHHYIDQFAREFKMPEIENKNLYFKFQELNLNQLVRKLHLNLDIPASMFYHGGYTEAKNRLDEFINNGLNDYLNSNDPSTNLTSKLSMYLHFGQISSLEIYLSIIKSNASEENIDAFIEQLVVRRELAINYIFYNQDYDDFYHITEPWAYSTMKSHLLDKREYVYTEADYLSFNTHDAYFNAAMKEMIYSGYMHNYMRMYWAKKIIEWSPTYVEAYEIIKKLNNAYFIDGRDALSYTGIAWCFGKHDRAWTERQIFGKLRYMNASGLERKFNIIEYVRQMNILEQKVLNNNFKDV